MENKETKARHEVGFFSSFFLAGEMVSEEKKELMACYQYQTHISLPVVDPTVSQ